MTHSTSASSAVDLDTLREQEYPWMRDAGVIYMNAASTGPMPQRAVNAADHWTRLRHMPQRVGLPLMFDAAARARRQFAALIGADESEVALMTNTTYGLNLAARALPLRPGIILTFEGEFPSCVYPYMALGSRGITLERVPLRDGLPDEDALVEAIGSGDVVAVVVSWVQFANGYVADLARIGAECRKHGAFFIVDAIQGVGARHIDVRELPVDILASGAQKWQLSPWGTGFVYVRKELVTQLEPHDVGWACMKASTDYGKLTDYDYDFFDDARRFEVVTYPYHDFAVANESTGLLLEIGTRQIQAHLEALGDRLIEWADSQNGVQMVTPRDASRRAGVLSFRVNNLEAAIARLRQAGVTFVPREGAIRLSPHWYNTTAEIDSVIELLSST